MAAGPISTRLARSRHGGIRLGEMERDSLLAHGTAFMLRDRLLRCSDYYVDKVCRTCGLTITHVRSAKPAPATHATWIVLKAGETVYQTGDLLSI